ncbi:tetratricopeptide repeat protein [Streptomyces smaragdinus]|uniref:tetratricopeptide repeat protein n=1 Tax=Streptomyces smaragdinus TaxID=2585196 RepID=UPI0012967524|nr:hypothetical protein [Streptomyces smaragdinus]
MTGLELLRADPALAALAAFPFDFDLERAEHGEEVRLASGAALTPIAGDDTGGTFFVCAGGPVLYASSEGQAGLIAGSVDEALELVVGLPGWRDLLGFTAGDPPDELCAEVAELEGEMRASYAPDLDEQRSGLLAALGLAALGPAELVARLHTAQLRTEPDFLLLNAEELLAYEPLHDHPQRPLYDVVLESGRADLALLRASPESWTRTAADGIRRPVALRAAQYDRDPGDLGFLRTLAEAEANYGMTDELRLAMLLIARHGGAAELPLLLRLRETSYDTHCGLSELPEKGEEELRAWARELDDALFGEDPEEEPELLWIEFARRQGRTEHARAALIRLLDATGPAEAPRLGTLAHELAELGDFAQAARAQKIHTALQDRAWDRGSALTRLASLQRQAGDPQAAWASLERALRVLDPPEAPAVPAPAPPADTSADGWRGYGLGHRVVQEHFELAAAAGDRRAYDRGRELLASLPHPPAAAVREAADRAARAVS